MPELEINELPVSTDVTTSSILHSKDSVGGDIQVTMGTVLGLLSLPSLSTLIPTTELTVDTGSDFALFSDASDGGEIKRMTFANFVSALGIPTLSGSASGGYYNIGDLQLRFGEVSNTIDEAQTFNFPQAFTNDCLACIVTNLEADGDGSGIHATSYNATGFTVNRANGLFSPATQTLTYIAIGY